MVNRKDESAWQWWQIRIRNLSETSCILSHLLIISNNQFRETSGASFSIYSICNQGEFNINNFSKKNLNFESFWKPVVNIYRDKLVTFCHLIVTIKSFFIKNGIFIIVFSYIEFFLLWIRPLGKSNILWFGFVFRDSFRALFVFLVNSPFRIRYRLGFCN